MGPRDGPRTEILPHVLAGGFDDDFSDVAVIGGGKVYRLARERPGSIADILVKETPFGCSTPILFMEHAGRRFYLLPRHGEREYRVTAPFVNYRANLWALKELGTRRIVAWSGPGTLTDRFGVGQFVLPDDLLDMTRGRPSTFFENTALGLLRQAPVFCPTLAGTLIGVLSEMGLEPATEAVYVVTEGPRLETPAEVRMLRRLGGDLVGMTLAPEAFLARELEMCYHPVAYVTAYAEGVATVHPADRKSRVDAALRKMPEIIWNLLDELPGTQCACGCEDAMLRYRQRGLIGDDFRDWIR